MFDQLESLVLEYVNEIRAQVLQRFQLCSRNSADIQLFITFLLDEYQAFVQAAQNVAILVSSLVRRPRSSLSLSSLSLSLSAGRTLSEVVPTDLASAQQTSLRETGLHGQEHSSVPVDSDRSSSTVERRRGGQVHRLFPRPVHAAAQSLLGLRRGDVRDRLFVQRLFEEDDRHGEEPTATGTRSSSEAEGKDANAVDQHSCGHSPRHRSARIDSSTVARQRVSSEVPGQRSSGLGCPSGRIEQEVEVQ